MEKYSRRKSIILSGQAFLALSSAMPLWSCADQKSDNKKELLSWDNFIVKVNSLAGVQSQKNWDQKSYVEKIKELMESLDVNDQFIKKFEQRYRNARKNFPEINAMHNEKLFMVSLLEFEAGEKIKLHDHPDMTGVILCTQGKINIQNYDLLPTKTPAGKILLKETSKVTMTPGNTAYLTAKAGNIHALQADKFTRLIDVFTPPYNKDRIKRSKWYAKNSTVYNGMKDVYEGQIL